jgi:acyl carrier protein
MENGIIDSTGILELVSFIEQKFDFRVGDEDLVPDNFDSVNNLVDYIKKKIAN